MFRRFLPVVGCAVFALSGCGGSSPSASSTVHGALGAKSIPAITPPAIIPGPLDGNPTPRVLALRRPLAVILENYAPDSRPQAGLASASTVIETLAEGGVTRFMALYLEKDAVKVGPVRSTRLYFDHWAAGFHAILGHVGGNDDAQALLWHLPKVFNIDENRWEKSLYDTGTPLFWRSTDRLAPHNLYTSTASLRNYAVQNGQNWAYSQASLLHTAPATLAARGKSTSIDIGFENPLFPAVSAEYSVHYQYDRNANVYLRSMGGVPHIDANTGHQLKPNNVIVMKLGRALADPNAGPTPESILLPTLGRGPAWFFRDGHITHGSWSQPNANAPLQFFGSTGKQVVLNPGQTWIEAVPPSSTISWQVR